MAEEKKVEKSFEQNFFKTFNAACIDKKELAEILSSSLDTDTKRDSAVKILKDEGKMDEANFLYNNFHVINHMDFGAMRGTPKEYFAYNFNLPLHVSLCELLYKNGVLPQFFADLIVFNAASACDRRDIDLLLRAGASLSIAADSAARHGHIDLAKDLLLRRFEVKFTLYGITHGNFSKKSQLKCLSFLTPDFIKPFCEVLKYHPLINIKKDELERVIAINKIMHKEKVSFEYAYAKTSKEFREPLTLLTALVFFSDRKHFIGKKDLPLDLLKIIFTFLSPLPLSIREVESLAFNGARKALCRDLELYTNPPLPLPISEVESLVSHGAGNAICRSLELYTNHPAFFHTFFHKSHGKRALSLLEELTTTNSSDKLKSDINRQGTLLRGEENPYPVAERGPKHTTEVENKDQDEFNTLMSRWNCQTR